MGREQLRHSRLRWSVSAAQFDDIQRAQAIALLEELPWGDLEQELYGLEAALALALEAVGDAIELGNGTTRGRNALATSSRSQPNRSRRSTTIGGSHTSVGFSTPRPWRTACHRRGRQDAARTDTSRPRFPGALTGPSRDFCVG